MKRPVIVDRSRVETVWTTPLTARHLRWKSWRNALSARPGVRYRSVCPKGHEHLVIW